MSSPDILPKNFLERMNLLYTQKEYTTILHSFCEEKPTSFRINTLKSSPDEILKLLTDNNLSVQPVDWYPDAFIYYGDKTDLTSLHAYQEGKLYIQGLSSMIPALILDPQPNNTILDIAAAPGSKTTLLATLMHNKGELVANDISRARLYKLRDNLKGQGVTNVNVLNLPGERIWRKYPEYFDKVLVDAPCSMEGRITCNDPDSYDDWSLKKIKELAHRQQFLLRSAITATKIGGTVIYSTCTLAPEENEGVIDWILEKEGENLSIETITIPKLKLKKGIMSWKNKKYNPEVEKTARIDPTNTMEGFFIAKIKKNKTTLRPELFKEFRSKLF